MAAGHSRERGRAAEAAQARALSAAGQWGPAAAAWSRVAAAEAAAGHAAEACQAWCLAGDALRRDERPTAAVEALDRALGAWDAGPSKIGSMERGAARAVRLGVLLDAGRVAEAVDEAQALEADAASPGLRVLALDLLAGALLAAGQVEASRAAAARLSAAAPPAAAPAAWFREGILWRMDGALSRARGHLHRVLEQAPEGPAWAGPRAAAQAELAELDLLDGNFIAAAAQFEAAAHRWGEAHRQSGAWRAHAGRLLALSEAGLRPDPAPLGPGLALAAERGLPLLAVRLQAVHGALLQRRGADGGPALAAAAETAAATGAVLLEGWVRLLRHQAGIVAGDGARARACLAEDAVLSLRVAAMP
ncbi:MAG: hypothetical protein RL071_1539 [Pseudomonadota bacterium]|jgi:tetratricopeptide (TPR) repeat protein